MASVAAALPEELVLPPQPMVARRDMRGTGVQSVPTFAPVVEALPLLPNAFASALIAPETTHLGPPGTAGPPQVAVPPPVLVPPQVGETGDDYFPGQEPLVPIVAAIEHVSLVSGGATEGRTGWCTQCGALISATDIFCGECGTARNPAARSHSVEDRGSVPAPVSFVAGPQPPPVIPAALVTPPVIPAALVTPPVIPAALVTPPVAVIDDVEETRIVGFHGDRFVLQFSTGENLTVSSTGLVGRNPVQQPGEQVGVFIPISDPGKSVSKTHLEFGQEGGVFWISDRYSSNGTVIREPDHPGRRCEPGKRYQLNRGTRVDIGDQFFVVS